MDEDNTKPKPFSMIREFHLADWFTLANAFCGIGALFCRDDVPADRRRAAHLRSRCGLIPAALVFDVLDGRIARWRQTASALGRELDSLADVISFGVAPAAHRLRLRHAGRCATASCWCFFVVLRRLPPGALQRHRRDAVRQAATR